MKKIKYNKVKGQESIFWYETKKGKLFYVRIRYKDRNDEWREKTASGIVNLTAAKRKRTELQEIVNKDQINVFEADKLKFREWREKYYETMSPAWATQTKMGTKNVLDKHLNHFDNLTLSQISKPKYQAFINQKLHIEDMALSTVRTIHNKMMALINYAVDDEILMRNKLRNIKIEKLQIAKVSHLEKDELAKLDELAKKELCEIKYACYILMRFGWRKSEVLGLKKGSVNIIGKNIIDISVTNAKSAYEDETPLKTDNSYRTNRLTGKNSQAILDALDVAKVIYESHGRPFNDESRILVNKHTCKTFCHSIPNNILAKLGGTLGINVSPHMLRHSFASHSLVDGNSVIAVADWLGHTPEMSQKVYNHTTKDSHLQLVKFANGE